jgi:hypothetical protein
MQSCAINRLASISLRAKWFYTGDSAFGLCFPAFVIKVWSILQCFLNFNTALAGLLVFPHPAQISTAFLADK